MQDAAGARIFQQPELTCLKQIWAFLYYTVDHWVNISSVVVKHQVGWGMAHIWCLISTAIRRDHSGLQKKVPLLDPSNWVTYLGTTQRTTAKRQDGWGEERDSRAYCACLGLLGTVCIVGTETALICSLLSCNFMVSRSVQCLPVKNMEGKEEYELPILI